VFPASVDTDVGRAYRRVAADGVAAHLTQHYVGDGYDLHLEIDAYPTRLPTDERRAGGDAGYGVAVFWRDVTARVRAEDELRTANATLATQNTDLEAQALELELANQQLQDQTAELEMQAEELQATAAQLEERTEEAEAAQRSAEAERARAIGILEATADAYFALDANLRIVAVNGAMERGSGLARSALLGQDFFRMFPGAVGTDFERYYRRASADGVEAHFTHDYSDGRLELVVEVDAYPAEGSGVAVFWRDVTNRVRADAALRESEARYRSLFAAIDEGFCVIEVLFQAGEGPGPGRPVDYRFVETNPAFAEQTGLADAVGRTIGELVPGVEAHWSETYGRVAVTGEPTRFRNGSDAMGRWFDVYAFRVGRPEARRVALLFTDVSAVVAAERERERLVIESEVARADAERAAARVARLQALTAALAGARTLDDVAAVIVAEGVGATGASTGALMARVVGTDEAVIVRQTRLTPEVLARYARFSVDAPGPSAHALRTAEAVFVTSREGPDGLHARFPGVDDVWERLGAHAVATVPLVIADAVVGVMAFTFAARRAFDAEDRAFFLALGRQAAQAVERARSVEAERTVAAEAEAARLAAEHERERAMEANRAKGQFLANMSHELRTPLNAIGGYVQLLEMEIHGPVTSEQRAALGRVQSAQQRLLGLITDILNHAKLESGRVEYDLRAVDVREVVAEVVPFIERQMAAKGLAFDVRMPDAPCLAWADREKLGQVLVNLLSNATKFTEARHPATGAPGRVTVDVAPWPGAAGPHGADAGHPDELCVRVADTGRGIPRDKKDAIFEPFVQVRSGYAHATEGTGLGLAISRDLTRGMGGDLRVWSREDEGSTFTVVLRRVAATDDAPMDGRTEGERRRSAAHAGAVRVPAV